MLPSQDQTFPQLSAADMRLLADLQHEQESLAAQIAAQERIIAEARQRLSSLTARAGTAQQAIQRMQYVEDRPLQQALIARLPEVRSISCDVDLSTALVTVRFNSCFEDQLPNVKAFLCKFITVATGSVNAVGFENLMQPCISVTLSREDRDTLLKGLQLTAATPDTPKVTSAQLAMRC